MLTPNRRSILRGSAAAALAAALARGRQRAETAPVAELLKDVLNPVDDSTGTRFFGTTGTPWWVINELGSSPRRGIAGYAGPSVANLPAPIGDEAVHGFADTGIGVLATTDTGAALQAEAGSPDGLGLAVTGAVKLTAAGLGKFKKGQSNAVVAGPKTPNGVKILVTLMQNPGPGNGLKYVKRTSDTGFTVYLQKPVGGMVSFAYFVIQ